MKPLNKREPSLGTGTWRFGAVGTAENGNWRVFPRRALLPSRRNVFRSFGVLQSRSRVMYKLCMHAWDLGRHLGFSFRRAVGEFKWPSLIFRDTATSCPGLVWVLSVSFFREVFELLLLSGGDWRVRGWGGWAHFPLLATLRVWAWLKEDA